MNAMKTRSMDAVVNDIYNRLAGIQNVLYRHSASQAELHRAWEDIKLLALALKEGDELLARAVLTNVEFQKQRDEAIRMVEKKRSEWIQFAEKQGRRALAAGVTLDKEEIDAEAVEAALDYIAGAIRGDASERALWDVARALEKLGQELNGKGV